METIEFFIFKCPAHQTKYIAHIQLFPRHPSFLSFSFDIIIAHTQYTGDKVLKGSYIGVSVMLLGSSREA